MSKSKRKFLSELRQFFERFDWKLPVDHNYSFSFRQAGKTVQVSLFGIKPWVLFAASLVDAGDSCAVSERKRIAELNTWLLFASGACVRCNAGTGDHEVIRTIDLSELRHDKLDRDLSDFIAVVDFAVESMKGKQHRIADGS